MKHKETSMIDKKEESTMKSLKEYLIEEFLKSSSLKYVRLDYFDEFCQRQSGMSNHIYRWSYDPIEKKVEEITKGLAALPADVLGQDVDNFIIDIVYEEDEDYDGDDENGRPIIRHLYWSEVHILPKREFSLEDYQKAAEKAAKIVGQRDSTIRDINSFFSRPNSYLWRSIRNEIPGLNNVCSYAVYEYSLREEDAYLLKLHEYDEDAENEPCSNIEDFTEFFIECYGEDYGCEYDEDEFESFEDYMEDSFDFKDLFEKYLHKKELSFDMKHPQSKFSSYSYTEAKKYFDAIDCSDFKIYTLVENNFEKKKEIERKGGK